MTNFAFWIARRDNRSDRFVGSLVRGQTDSSPRGCSGSDCDIMGTRTPGPRHRSETSMRQTASRSPARHRFENYAIPTQNRK